MTCRTWKEFTQAVLLSRIELKCIGDLNEIRGYIQTNNKILNILLNLRCLEDSFGMIRLIANTFPYLEEMRKIRFMNDTHYLAYSKLIIEEDKLQHLKKVVKDTKEKRLQSTEGVDVCVDVLDCVSIS